MKRIRQAAMGLLTLLALLIAPLLSAAAVEEQGDARFADRSWDEVTSAFLAEKGVDPARISLGYYNTVTGEEHYLNGDEYRVAGSMYKVALNMYWSEKIFLGEKDWDMPVLGVPYSTAQRWSIVNSDNDYSAALFEMIGTYREYREAVAHFYGEDPETVDRKYYENNFSTARQIIFCLRTLYQEPERYPGVLDCMLEAEPGRYFKFAETRFDIAQKYGYLSDDTGTYIDACALAYTDDPILIVMFTCNVGMAENRLGEYCALMCDYAQYNTALRREQEAEAARVAAREEAERLAARQAAQEEADRLAAQEAERAAALAEAKAREEAARAAREEALAAGEAAMARAQEALSAAPTRSGELRIRLVLLGVCAAAAGGLGLAALLRRSRRRGVAVGKRRGRP